jgi:hypothetical protein
MSERDRVHSIQQLSEEVLRSPYVFKDLPEELHRLRSVMKNVETLVREDVPFLISEIKRLRSENKRLTAGLEIPAAADH